MSEAVRTQIELQATPERVWEVVMDPHQLERWVTTHVALGDGAPRELENGSSFEQELKVSGAKFTVTWSVSDCDRPRQVSWSGRGPAGSRAHVRYLLEPRGEDTTAFEYENEFELPGGALGRLAGRAVGDRVARREAERSLQNLKRLVEA
jgi:carbon monoxide dehydrogenase subunit G